jgi:hypothetical protein
MNESPTDSAHDSAAQPPVSEEFEGIEFACPGCGEALTEYYARCPHCGLLLEDVFCATYRPAGSRVVKVIAFVFLAVMLLALAALVIGRMVGV